MDISIDAILTKYGEEIARLTQRALIAEARADMAEAKVNEQED